MMDTLWYLHSASQARDQLRLGGHALRLKAGD